MDVVFLGQHFNPEAHHVYVPSFTVIESEGLQWRHFARGKDYRHFPSLVKFIHHQLSSPESP